MTSTDAPVGVVPILEAIAAATDPDADCIIGPGERHLSWGAFTDRHRRLAGYLHSRGLGCHRERDALADHESGQDHLGLLLHNCPEYLESMIGAFGARVAPININYRYTPSELVEVLGDAGVTAVVVHDALSAGLGEALTALPDVHTVIQVADASAAPLLPGAIRYEDALTEAPPLPDDVVSSPDDVYLLATGGTTGRPRAVMWRNGDAVIGCFDAARDVQSVDEYVARLRPGLRSLPTAPFMHGAAHWTALRALLAGGTVIIPSFAVGRAQTLLYHLRRLKDSGRLPDLPVFLDSPMSIDASELFWSVTSGSENAREEASAESCPSESDPSDIMHNFLLSPRQQRMSRVNVKRLVAKLLDEVSDQAFANCVHPHRSHFLHR